MYIFIYIYIYKYMNNVYMYSGNKNNKNTFLTKRYFATYVVFSSSIKIEIFDKVT